MAYEELNQDVKSVKLGGVNKETGKPNPTKIEGYLIRVEQRPNKMKNNQPQNFYVFQTKRGDLGVYATAGADVALRGHKLGLMTFLEATGEELDTGKGFPMKVYKAGQDKTNSISLDAIVPAADASNNYEDIEDESSLDGEEAPLDEIAPPRAKAPAQRAAPVTQNRQAELNAMLAKRRVSSAVS